MVLNVAVKEQILQLWQVKTGLLWERTEFYLVSAAT